MATLIRINVLDPQNVLDTYGAGALVRLERATASTMSGASEITTVAVVAGTTEYEYKDTTGVAGTHWYRSRYSKATPSVAADYGGYSSAFQAGAASGEVITLDLAKTWCSIGDTTDDPWMPMAVNAMNRAIVNGVGIDLGPSPDTERVYDGARAARCGDRLYIPGGIRTFTAVEITVDGGSTWTAVTSDVRLGPRPWDRTPGEPYGWVEFLDPLAITGTYRRFPSGRGDVKVTAAAFEGFGFDAWPSDIIQDGLSGLQRMSLDRDRAGGSGFPNETNAARYLNAALLRSYRAAWAG